MNKLDLADKTRESLSIFYVVRKTFDDMIGQILATSISRFAKTSMLSKLSNLDELTFDPDYAGICGFNRKELEPLLDEFQESALSKLIVRKVIGSTSDDLRKLIQHWRLLLG